MFNKKDKLEKTKEKYERKTEVLKAKKGFLDQVKSIRFDTFTKAMVALIIFMACIDLQLSYVLAFLDKIQIAEELSKQVCTTILGVAFVYMVRAYFDSRAEYKTNETLDKDIINKTMEVANQSEINTTEFENLVQEENKDVNF